jgi:hypothetical protein
MRSASCEAGFRRTSSTYTPGVTLGPCCRAVAEELDRHLASEADSAVADDVRVVRASLDQPLRVAVTGRVNAGKSTIVNALLHQRIAATDVSECTRHVTWFRYGVPERVEVVLRSGERRPVRLREDGRLPLRLDLDADPNAPDALVDHLDVFLSNDSLRDLVLIDTPGLASLDAEVSGATRELLAIDRSSRAAASQADVLLFVLGGELQRDDTGFLDAFHRLFSGLSATAVNTIAVLNKVDQLVDDELDPVSAAADRCARLGDQLRATVAGVVPLVGLLAETAESGSLTQTDLEVLRAATEREQRVVDRALLSTDRYLRSKELAEEPRRRERLLELLDLSGTRIVLDVLRGTEAGLQHAVDAIRQRSGLQHLWGMLRGEFVAHADVLKASSALAGLERIAYRAAGDERTRLLDLLDGVAVMPEMHRVRELSVRQRVAAGEVTLLPAQVAEVRALFGPGDATDRLGVPPAATAREAMDAASRGAQRWKQAANDAAAGAAHREVAATVARSYELLWQEMLTSAPRQPADAWPPPPPGAPRH